MFGQTSQETKPLLIVLPGASGGLTKDFSDLLVPALRPYFDVHIRPQSKWVGWDTSKNAKLVVESMCPKETIAAPWYVLGCSFGNRVATSIVADALTPVPPNLILTGYPMYGPNGNEQRVNHIQTLPQTARVLCISGEKDEFLNKNVPAGKPTGKQLWDSVLTGMTCRSTTTVHMVPKGGHGVYPSAKGQKNETTVRVVNWIKAYTK